MSSLICKAEVWVLVHVAFNDYYANEKVFTIIRMPKKLFLIIAETWSGKDAV
jgi:hypothetical protein